MQGAASQSANLSEWRNSAGTRLFSVSSAGSVMFPDGSIQSTAFTGGGGTVTAGNVSAGAFGANTGGGNYSFPAKLGIGVPSPTYPLEMAATGSNPARASFTSGTGIAGLQLSTNGENWYVDNRGASETPNNRFGIFNNTGAEAFTILQGGNAGVGIPNPLYKLSVGGVIQSTSGGFRFPDGTTQITAATGASTMSAANVSSGSFGANTGGGNYTFPAQLTVSAGLSATGGNFELRDAGVSDSTAVRIFNSAGNLYLQNGSGDHIYFRGKTGGLNMDLTNAGNLGIGVSGPTYRLDVAGDINFTGALRTGGSPGTSGYVLRSNGASAPTWVATSTLGLTGATTITAANISSGSFGANTGGGNYTFPAAVTVTGAANFAGAGIWNASGNVGIGTASPGARLVVEDGTTSDQLRIGDTSGGNYFQIGRNLSTGVLDFNGTQAGYRGYVFANSEQFTVVDDASARIFVATTGANSLAGIRLQARDASSSYDWYLDSRGGMGSPTNKFGIADNGGVERFTILSGGNVGIGVTNPASYKLEVNGVIFSNSGGFRFPDGTTQITAASGGGTVAAANVSSGAFGANTGGGNYTFPGTLGASGVITSSGSNTNIGAHPSYGTSYSAFWRTGSDYAVMTDATNLYVNSPASGGSILFRHANVDAMTLSGTTLTIGGGTGKINVGTVDPVYEINGEKFATYMAGMIGVKEEVAGVFALSCKDNFCSKRIEFASEPKGSDLWLFGKTTDIRKHLPQASVMLTPSFDGRVSYEKGEGVLTIKATTFQPRDTVEVSYRITAPRFDADQWKNTTDDDARGFIIND